jgi:hypothetical protein
MGSIQAKGATQKACPLRKLAIAEVHEEEGSKDQRKSPDGDVLLGQGWCWAATRHNVLWRLVLPGCWPGSWSLLGFTSQICSWWLRFSENCTTHDKEKGSNLHDGMKLPFLFDANITWY